MKTGKLNAWLSLGANIGIVAGQVLLIVKFNNELSISVLDEQEQSCTDE